MANVEPSEEIAAPAGIVPVCTTQVGWRRSAHPFGNTLAAVPTRSRPRRAGRNQKANVLKECSSPLFFAERPGRTHRGRDESQKRHASRTTTEPKLDAGDRRDRRADLSRLLDQRGVVAAIRNALNEHLVLFLPKQSLTPVQQRDFAARFGHLYLHPFYPGHERPDYDLGARHDPSREPLAQRRHRTSPPRHRLPCSTRKRCLGGDTL